MTVYIALGVFTTLVSILVCHALAKQRGQNPVFWGTMGLLFGPFALPFLFLGKKHVNR